MKFHLVYFLFLLLSLIACTPKSKRAVLAKEKYNQPVTNSPPEIVTPAVVNNTPTQNDLTSLFKRCKPAVFIVYTGNNVSDFQGSGFFISSSGLAVSNYHVFEGTYRGYESIVTTSGAELKIEKIIERNNENDYIIFQVATNKPVSYLPIARQALEVGQEVFAIGNPKGLEHTLSTGIVSGYRLENRMVQTTTEITHGSSGGPLLNMQGEVVGITTSGLGEANLNFAINIQILPLHNYINPSKFP